MRREASNFYFLVFLIHYCKSFTTACVLFILLVKKTIVFSIAVSITQLNFVKFNLNSLQSE